MALTQYLNWSQSIADELLELLTDEDRRRIAAIIAENSRSRPWQDVRQQDIVSATRFLGATPAQRAARWQKLHPDDRLVLWLRARSLGLQSANAIAIAERVARIEGMKYREAVQDVAQSVLQYALLPQPEDLLGSTSE